MTFYSYDNLVAGLEISLGPKKVTKQEIIEFASEFDPAPFHLDEEAAKLSPFEGLCASGFHTCAIIMRMICDAYILKSTSQGGPGVETCKFIVPVRPDDILTGKSTVLSSRMSKSRPQMAIIKMHHILENQHGEPVFEMVTTNMFNQAVREPTQ